MDSIHDTKEYESKSNLVFLDDILENPQNTLKNKRTQRFKLPLGPSTNTYPILPTISNIGRYIDIRTPAITIPITTISTGSRIDVNVVIAESTSAS